MDTWTHLRLNSLKFTLIKNETNKQTKKHVRNARKRRQLRLKWICPKLCTKNQVIFFKLAFMYDRFTITQIERQQQQKQKKNNSVN